MESGIQELYVTSGSLFVVMGLVHGLLTLRDLGTPRSFTPTDDSVRRAMMEARLRFAPGVEVWRAWLGFNLTHSLGLLVFGLAAAGTALFAPALFAESALLRIGVVAVALAYAATAARFFFWAPALGCSLGALGFLVASLLG